MLNVRRLVLVLVAIALVPIAFVQVQTALVPDPTVLALVQIVRA